MTFKPNSIVLLLAALGATAATAQTSGHEHAGHGAPAAPVAAQGTTSAKPAGADHGAASSAQGGSAPTDARDPHAYSGGYQLGVGQYALSGTRQLKLADEHNFGALLMNRLERDEDKAAVIHVSKVVYRLYADMFRGLPRTVQNEVQHALA